MSAPTDQTTGGGTPAASENTNVAEQSSSGGLSSADVVANFLRRAQAKPAQNSDQSAAQAPSENEATTEATTEPTEEQPKEADTEVTSESGEPQTEGTDTAPDDSDAEVLSQFPEKAQEKINKRIRELNAAKKAAEEQAAATAAKVAELEAKLKQATEAVPEAPPAAAVQPASSGASGLVESVNDEAGLVRLEKDARTALDWINSNSDKVIRAIAQEAPAVEIDGKEYTIEQIKSIQRVATETLTLGVPARRNFLQQRATAVDQAKKKFPEFFKRDTAEYQQVQTILGQYPQLASLPNRELFLGYALRGLKAEAAEQEAAAAKAKQAKPAEAKKPPMMGDTGAAAPKPKTATGANAVLKREFEEARKAFEESGSKQDAVRLEVARRKLRAAS